MRNGERGPLQQGELLERSGHLDAAAVAYRQALEGDPASVLATRGARRVAARIEERHDRARDSGAPTGPSFDPGRLVEAALLAQHLGQDGLRPVVPLDAPSVPAEAVAVRSSLVSSWLR